MPRLKATAAELQDRKTQAVFDYGMTMSKLNWNELGKRIHRDERTVRKKRQNPETFTLGDIRGIVKAFHLSDEQIIEFLGIK